MNLLSIGAAYGVMVAIFQWGWGGEPPRRRARPAPSRPFVPMMMFAILFGLSMDYEVFLLSRIREEYDRTGDNPIAVADGLGHTARVITAAALIMATRASRWHRRPRSAAPCSPHGSRRRGRARRGCG